ncbi:uncharacterized protein PG998_012856 [Apiospora kogelbergensis]|uniref:uncharacterized protein n=1 Tax=Apiospora kogelbergensis TaxID=1337665 RepID=UPI0031310906
MATNTPENQPPSQPAAGPCIICRTPTTRHCFTCSGPFICSFGCNKPNGCPAAPHAAPCGHAGQTTADALKCNLVEEGLIPADRAVQRDYGFDRCLLPADQARLLGVYRVVLVDLGIPTARLDQWRDAKKLRQNIGKLLDDYSGHDDETEGQKAEKNKTWVPPAQYVDWFKEHGYVFDGGIHGSHPEEHEVEFLSQ